jgi:hypothetical protein
MNRGKRTGLLAGVVATMVVILVTFSTSSSRLTCEGTITLAGDTGGFTSRPATFAATVETPRWFAVWSNHDAKISWEIEPDRHTGQGHYSPDPFRSRITTFSGTTQGWWSPQSKQLSVKVVPDRLETFAGLCE